MGVAHLVLGVLLATQRPHCYASQYAVLLLQMRALVEMDNSGLVVLLEQDQYDDLARMYALFKRLDEGLNMIRTIMGEHLKSAGSALVQDPESTKDPVDFVQRLLAMKDKYDKYVCAIRMVPSPHAGAGCLSR